MDTRTTVQESYAGHSPEPRVRGKRPEDSNVLRGSGAFDATTVNKLSYQVMMYSNIAVGTVRSTKTRPINFIFNMCMLRYIGAGAFKFLIFISQCSSEKIPIKPLLSNVPLTSGRSWRTLGGGETSGSNHERRRRNGFDNDT